MIFRVRPNVAETIRKRSQVRRVTIVFCILLFSTLIIIARLLELQIVKGAEYREAARLQHFGGIVLPARRGEILARNSKTGELSTLATNTTLDLLYVDPYITDDPTFVAETLADTLLTEEFHALCSKGDPNCPRELAPFYKPAFDPLEPLRSLDREELLEPLPLVLRRSSPEEMGLPDLTEARRLFARDIEAKISKKRVHFVPLKYGASKVAMKAVEEQGLPGIYTVKGENLVYADPEEITQSRVGAIARTLAQILDVDPIVLQSSLLSRPLRYVPIMRRLPPDLGLSVKELLVASHQETLERKVKAGTKRAAEAMQDPLRSIALLPEHWRFYPDSTLGSHVAGFLNTNNEAQYGIERTFDPQLRGQEGLISTVSDPTGGQIVTAEQTIIAPRDGDTLVLTIDREIQKEVERILAEAVERYDASSGQVIIIDPFTGRVIAMANAPLFDANSYGGVYEKEPILLKPYEENKIVVEVYHPETNARIVKAYVDDVFTDKGRSSLTEKTQEALKEAGELYDIEDLARYYLYIGEHSRIEVFPTDIDGVWLKYTNTIGVGAYLNRAVQEIYEPGSVLKAVTMATALDQGEVSPSDTYNDEGPVQVDEYTIRNALHTYYGTVTMTNCLEFSINTCMTSVSEKLGKKLFARMLERFGFHRISGIELEDELPGEMLPWKKWSNALLATTAYGQGISATPLQMAVAFAALANGGKLMKPTIIDSILRPDGTTHVVAPRIIDQVITRETSDTISAMLVSAVEKGYAKRARVPGYRIAGKTGTSQIAGPGGKYETGTGSTIASFGGYGPADKPVFAMLVKIDRPRKVVHGAEAAAPVFQETAAFLFKYYGIPPQS